MGTTYTTFRRGAEENRAEARYLMEEEKYKGYAQYDDIGNRDI